MSGFKIPLIHIKNDLKKYPDIIYLYQIAIRKTKIVIFRLWSKFCKHCKFNTEFHYQAIEI